MGGHSPVIGGLSARFVQARTSGHTHRNSKLTHAQTECPSPLLLTFKAIYGHSPGYLTDVHVIAIKEQMRYLLRSASGLTLNYPSLKLKKTLGDRAFSSAAPTLWNSLPLHFRLEDDFERLKSVLKRHLFKLAFYL